MVRGKQTCKILKDIRRQIAEANDIEYITSECQYKGDCTGTCPKCESEVRYLEHQLERRPDKEWRNCAPYTIRKAADTKVISRQHPQPQPSICPA